MCHSWLKILSKYHQHLTGNRIQHTHTQTRGITFLAAECCYIIVTAEQLIHIYNTYTHSHSHTKINRVNSLSLPLVPFPSLLPSSFSPNRVASPASLASFRSHNPPLYWPLATQTTLPSPPFLCSSLSRFRGRPESQNHCPPETNKQK